MTATALRSACNPFSDSFDLSVSHMYRNHPEFIVIIDDDDIDEPATITDIDEEAPSNIEAAGPIMDVIDGCTDDAESVIKVADTCSGDDGTSDGDRDGKDDDHFDEDDDDYERNEEHTDSCGDLLDGCIIHADPSIDDAVAIDVADDEPCEDEVKAPDEEPFVLIKDYPAGIPPAALPPGIPSS